VRRGTIGPLVAGSLGTATDMGRPVGRTTLDVAIFGDARAYAPGDEVVLEYDGREWGARVVRVLVEVDVELV
jgi:hypothetical protein